MEPSIGRSNHGEGGAVTRSYANNAAQSSRPLQMLDGGRQVLAVGRWRCLSVSLMS